MNCIMVAAVSEDGFLTRGDDPDPSSWTSKEDKQHLASMVKQHRLQVFGSRTYNTYHPRPDPAILRVVLTSSPRTYQDQSVIGQVEFHGLTPQEFVDRYESKYPSCLILGGSHVYQEFLEAGLIDEIYLTIEPVTHGNGVPLIKNGSLSDYIGGMDSKTTSLNQTGTKLKHYYLKK